MNIYTVLFFIVKFTAMSIEAQQRFLVDIVISESQKQVIQDARNHGGLDLHSISYRKDKLKITASVTNSTMDALKKANIPFEVLAHTFTQSNERRVLDAEPPGIVNGKITFERDLRYEEIMQYLDGIAQRSTAKRQISVQTIGRSFQGRELRLVKIEHPHARNIMFFDAGIHAREWLAIITALYLITSLIEESHTNPVTKMNWYIVPLVNPDGYVQSYTHERYHRKNMNFTSCPANCKTCGIDLNRNYGYMWGVSSDTGYLCGETYPGDRAFSEKETAALSRTLKQYQNIVKLYVALHTYGCDILYPWGYANIRCHDADDLIKVARKATNAMNRLQNKGRPCNWGVYHAGRMPGGGGGDDYAKGSLNIKYSYTMELQGGAAGSGFLYNITQIKPFVTQSYLGITTLANYVNNKFRTKRRTAALTHNYSAIKSSFRWLYMAIFYFIITP